GCRVGEQQDAKDCRNTLPGSPRHRNLLEKSRDQTRTVARFIRPRRAPVNAPLCEESFYFETINFEDSCARSSRVSIDLLNNPPIMTTIESASPLETTFQQHVARGEM